MDKTAIVETLVMSEKTHAIVSVKIVNTDKHIIGAVQKVLNQVIIVKPFTSQPVTLTFSDIESVSRSTQSIFARLVRNLAKILHIGFWK